MEYQEALDAMQQNEAAISLITQHRQSANQNFEHLANAKDIYMYIRTYIY